MPDKRSNRPRGFEVSDCATYQGLASAVRINGPNGFGRVFKVGWSIYETGLSWQTISASQFSSSDL